MMINDDAGRQRLLSAARVIAVVGISPKSERPSHYCAKYLLDHGYTIIPVNPGQKEVLGLTCYPDLLSIPVKVDMVNVFRNAEDVPPIAEDAVRIGARYLWLQLGIINDEAAQQASAAGLDVVQDRCVKMEHMRLMAR
jgi:predicted CoA-binding protein